MLTAGSTPHWLLLCWGMLLFIGDPYCYATTDNQELKLLFPPIAQKKDIEQRLAPLRDYIRQRLKKSVVIEVVPSYLDMAKLLARGDGDLGLMDVEQYQKLNRQQAGLTLVVQLEQGGETRRKGVIVTQNQKISSLDSLAGKRVGFGLLGSTTTDLLPCLALERSLVGGKGALAGYRHVGSLSERLLQLQSGLFDAVVLEKNEYLLAQKKYNLSLIWESKWVENQFLVARRGLSSKLVKAIRAILVELKDREFGRLVMDAVKINLTSFRILKTPMPLRSVKHLSKGGCQ